jgi:PAS domain S-box-containing protein
MVSAKELEERPSRPPDYKAESEALLALARDMATAPGGTLQRLAETALSLCRAGSAGLSLLEDGDQKSNFHWRGLAGAWAPHIHGINPRDFSPFGTVLDSNVALLCMHPERDFPYFANVTPPVDEALLVPFYVENEAVGTMWVVAHDSDRRFDCEDLRILTSLGTFAAAAYRTLLSLNANRRGAAIVESSDDAIVSKDLNGVIQSWNNGAQRIFGYTATEVIGKPITIIIPPDRRDEEPVILGRIRRGERIEHFETVRVRKDGSPVDISLSVSPVLDEQGKIIGASKIARDITDRKRSDQQIRMLAREAEHRSKNLLASVQATIKLTHADSVDGFKQAVEGRLAALASVLELFAKSQWRGAELHHLISKELLPYAAEPKMRTRIDGPPVFLDPTNAQAIAVIMHELATNAAKHGALSVPQGQISVEWSLPRKGDLLLRWTETGGPPSKPPAHKGFGTRVMSGIIEQLKGDVQFDWRSEGLACQISVPMSENTTSKG